MTRRYLTQSRLAELERVLSDRDLAVIVSLDRLRVATTEQLKRLHFTGLSPHSASRQTTKTLRRLTELQVVVSLPRHVGGVRSGSHGTVWSLDVAGQRLASACGPAGGSTPRRPWTPSLTFLAHRLAVSECFVAVTEAARSDRCEMLDFEAEPLCWRRYASPFGGWAHLKPDAFVRLAVGDYERGAFVEIDRATEATTTVARKLATYRRFWEAGKEQTRRGYFPQVIISVPTEARKDALVEVCGKLPAELWPLFRVVEAGDLVAAILGEEPS